MNQFKENKNFFIGIIIGFLIMGTIFFYPQLKEKIASMEKVVDNKSNENIEDEVDKQKEPDWLERTEEIINKYHEISDEADALKDQGKYAEAIVKYKEALDLISYHILFAETKEDFYKTYNYLSAEEQLDKSSEFIALGNRTAATYYSLSFVYRDAEGLANSMQYAIDSAKQAVKHIDKVLLLEEIQDELDPDRLKFGEDWFLKSKASYLSMLGDLYRIYGTYDLAIKTHKQAIILAPDNADYYVWYGLALYLDGQYSLGRQQWRKALEFEPDNVDANKFLNQFSF